MEPKISKAQIEVWEWKEMAYEKTKDMTMKERMAYVHEHTKDVLAELNITRKARRVKDQIGDTVL